jgi:hypothetical protein
MNFGRAVGITLPYTEPYRADASAASARFFWHAGILPLRCENPTFTGARAC